MLYYKVITVIAPLPSGPGMAPECISTMFQALTAYQKALTHELMPACHFWFRWIIFSAASSRDLYSKATVWVF